MRRAVAALVVLSAVALAAPAQEGSRHEDVVKEMIDALGKMTTALATVQDRDSAQVAAPELRKLAEKWHELRKKAGELPPPEAGEKQRLAKEYKAKLDEGLKKFYGEATRVQFIQGGETALREIRPVLKRADD